MCRWDATGTIVRRCFGIAARHASKAITASRRTTSGWTLANNTLRALGMFNVVGDTVWANTLPNKPTLDEVGGVFLVLGVMAALYRLFQTSATGRC